MGNKHTLAQVYDKQQIVSRSRTMAGMSTSVSRRLVMELLPSLLPCSVVKAS
jgi:hypothetical protein